MFLADPPPDPQLDREREANGYIHNYSRLWSWRPGFLDEFADLRNEFLARSTLTNEEQAVVVASAASRLGDSYCAVAWAPRLVEATDEATAAEILAGREPATLPPRAAALVTWARAVVTDPNATTAADVEALRAAGLTEAEIFDATVLVGLRLAFSTVNDALGAGPDTQLLDALPPAVRAAIDFGRAPEPGRPD